MPAISRKGDSVMSPNGSGYKCQSPVETSVDECNSNNVFANSILIVVAGNKIAPHNLPGCEQIDQSTLSKQSSMVFIGGKGVGRIGDKYSDNTITAGSPNVFSG